MHFRCKICEKNVHIFKAINPYESSCTPLMLKNIHVHASCVHNVCMYMYVYARMYIYKNILAESPGVPRARNIILK